MSKEKACKNCHRIIENKEEKKCPVCGSNQLTSLWSGYVYIIDPEKSEIAKKMKITVPGKYALKLNR